MIFINIIWPKLVFMKCSRK